MLAEGGAQDDQWAQSWVWIKGLTSRGAGDGPRQSWPGLPSGQAQWRKPSSLSLSGASVPAPGEWFGVERQNVKRGGGGMMVLVLAS